MPGQEKTAWFCQKISQLKNSMYVTAIGILRIRRMPRTQYKCFDAGV